MIDPQPDTDPALEARWVLVSETLAERTPDGVLARAFWTGGGWGRLEHARICSRATMRLPEDLWRMELAAGHLAARWVPASTYESLHWWRVRVSRDAAGLLACVLTWQPSSTEAIQAAKAQYPDGIPYGVSLLA